MELTQFWKESLVSGFVFAISIIILYIFRERNIEPPVSPQTAAAVLIILISFYVYRGGGFVGSWILAFGPSLAFTLNLFLPVPTMGTFLKVAFGLVPGIPLSGVIAVIGYAVGYGAAGLMKMKNRPSES